MGECENGMHHNGERLTVTVWSSWLKALATLGSVAACGRASFTIRFILFLLLATFLRRAERRDKCVQGQFVYTRSSWFSRAANTAAEVTKNLCLLWNSNIHCFLKQKLFSAIHVVVLWFKHKISAVGSASVFRCWNERIRWTCYIRPAQTFMWCG
jgi:hypothetical protein